MLEFSHVHGAQNYENTLPSLKGHIEISYVSEGITEEIRANGETTINRTGDISCNMFLEPLPIRSSGWHEHHTVAFNVEFEYSEQAKKGYIPLSRHIPYEKDSSKAHRLIDSIIQASQIREGSDLLTSGLFLQLLDTVSRLSQSNPQKADYNNIFYANKAKSYILSHINAPITQGEVARHLRITPEYLCDVFKAATGETVMSYINRTKLKKLKALMDRENLKLYEAAEIFGYSDPNYVSRLYKKLYGKNITQR